MSSFDGCEALLLKHAIPKRQPLPQADEIRLAVTRAAFKRGGKKVRMPAYVMANLKRLYVEGRSVREIAALVGRCPGAIFYLFKQHGVPVGKRGQRPVRFHNGVKYAFDGKHYFQTAKGKQGVSLHKVIWEAKHGPVPAGHRLVLCGSPHDVENVRMLTLGELARYMVAQREAKKVLARASA